MRLFSPVYRFKRKGQIRHVPLATPGEHTKAYYETCKTSHADQEQAIVREFIETADLDEIWPQRAGWLEIVAARFFTTLTFLFFWPIYSQSPVYWIAGTTICLIYDQFVHPQRLPSYFLRDEIFNYHKNYNQYEHPRFSNSLLNAVFYGVFYITAGWVVYGNILNSALPYVWLLFVSDLGTRWFYSSDIDPSKAPSATEIPEHASTHTPFKHILSFVQSDSLKKTSFSKNISGNFLAIILLATFIFIFTVWPNFQNATINSISAFEFPDYGFWFVFPFVIFSSFNIDGIEKQYVAFGNAFAEFLKKQGKPIPQVLEAEESENKDFSEQTEKRNEEAQRFLSEFDETTLWRKFDYNLVALLLRFHATILMIIAGTALKLSPIELIILIAASLAFDLLIYKDRIPTLFRKKEYFNYLRSYPKLPYPRRRNWFLTIIFYSSCCFYFSRIWSDDPLLIGPFIVQAIFLILLEFSWQLIDSHTYIVETGTHSQGENGQHNGLATFFHVTLSNYTNGDRVLYNPIFVLFLYIIFLLVFRGYYDERVVSPLFNDDYGFIGDFFLTAFITPFAFFSLFSALTRKRYWELNQAYLDFRNKEWSDRYES